MSSIDDALTACRTALTTLMLAAQELPADDLTGRANAMLAVDELRNEFAVVRDTVEHGLIDAMGDLPELEVEGATLEVRRSDSRKAWAHKDLAAEVASRLAQMSIDMDTGEILKTPEELIQDALTYAGVSYWKIKALNTIGISADDYCEITEGSLKVRIHRI